VVLGRLIGLIQLNAHVIHVLPTYSRFQLLAVRAAWQRSLSPDGRDGSTASVQLSRHVGFTHISGRMAATLRTDASSQKARELDCFALTTVRVESVTTAQKASFSFMELSPTRGDGPFPFNISCYHAAA
jgi:hypothetical protein